jgi:Na+/H+-dicarboxylate symporter
MNKSLPVKIVAGIVLGVVFAYLMIFLGYHHWVIDWIYPWGQIFIRLLKLIAVPLILFSIIAGIGNLKDFQALGRMGIRTLGLYVITTLTAITIGLIIGNLAKPGSGISKDLKLKNRLAYERWAKDNNIELIDDECVSCELKDLPDVETADKENITVEEKIKSASERKNQSPLVFLYDIIPDNIFYSLQNNGLMLQVIFFALFFGIAMVKTNNYDAIHRIIVQTNEVFLMMVQFIMSAAPFFVFALMAGEIVKIADDNLHHLNETLFLLGKYTLWVIAGLFLMIFAIYPLLIRLFRKDFVYLDFFRKIIPAQLLAFSTSSSAATLPVTLECVEENLKVKPEVASFVLPIGATVNMDGTSLYQAVAVMFLAQWHDIDLSLGRQLVIVFTALLGSIGAAAVPGAGLIMLIMILESVGLNPAWISIILPVDRILDMVRTVVNVTSDMSVCYIIDKQES